MFQFNLLVDAVLVVLTSIRLLRAKNSLVVQGNNTQGILEIFFLGALASLSVADALRTLLVGQEYSLGNQLCFLFACLPFIILFYRGMFSRIALLDCPDGKLKLHQQPIPFVGGAVLAYCIVSLVRTAWSDPAMFSWVFQYKGEWNLLKMSLMPVLLAFPVDFYDDIYRLSPGRRFFFQVLFCACAVFVFKSGACLFSQALSFLYILSLINAFNLIDIMDGLCITTAMFSALGLCVITSVIQLKFVCLILVVCLINLFLFNCPPALIYLGNSGSGLLGALFSMFILNFFELSNFREFVSITTIFGVFFAELLALIIIRTALGIRPYNGSPHHFAIFLKSNGWQKWRILFFVSTVSGLLNILAWLIFNKVISYSLYFSIALLSLALWTIVIYFNNQKSNDEKKELC